MGKVCELQDIINGFNLAEGNDIGAEKQLFVFTEGYARLSVEEANQLRSNYDAKERLTWFRVGSRLLKRRFDSADKLHKEKLFRMFFALYSFGNLDAGYDAVLDVIDISDRMKEEIEISRKSWAKFRDLTSNLIAIGNIESRII